MEGGKQGQRHEVPDGGKLYEGGSGVNRGHDAGWKCPRSRKGAEQGQVKCG